MKLFELFQPLQEARHFDWIILPATMALYNKRTVDIITAASEWKNHATTILVCTKPDDKNRICFVASSGNDFDSYEKKIGRHYEAGHDQTGQSKGSYKLVNVVVIKDGEIVKQANDVGVKSKASLAVFK